MSTGSIRVLVVDDSLVAREMLKQILGTEPGIEVVGAAKDGSEAVEMVAALHPDLVTMDIHMPRMDGMAAIEKIMAFNPTPILVVSSSVHGEGVGRAFDALAAGALEVVKKPEPRDWEDLERIGRDIIRRVKILSRIKVITHIRGRRDRPVPEGPVTNQPVSAGGRSLVAIGSSTGGPSALLNILGRLPVDFPVPIVIAQHIAEGFIPGLVSWLDSGCPIKVKAAEDGELTRSGVAYIAPTGCNLGIDGVRLRFIQQERGQLYIPSADVLFSSTARTVGSRAVGVILTGMGADGAIGLNTLRATGAATIAQDEATCTVFGMPKSAIDMGAVGDVLPVHGIAEELVRLVGG